MVERVESTKLKLVVDALNLSHGGGVIVMARLVAALMRRGTEVTLVAARKSVVEALQVEPTRVALHTEAAGAARSMLFRHLRMPALIRDTAADGLISFNFRTPVAGPQVTYHVNVIPYLTFAERCGAVGPMRALQQARSARRALRYNTANAFESRHLLAMARRGNSEEPTDMLAYTGIDIPSWAGPREAPPEPETICLITSGAVHKDNDIVLRAFRAFAEHRPRARLDIFGKEDAIRTTLSAEMRAYCANTESVRFRGYVGRQELFENLACAFALITASRLESFYMVALEAMIMGCPVVAADISSVRESTGEAGLLFAPGDWRAAAAALTALVEPESWAQASKAGFEWAKGFEGIRLADDFAARLIAVFQNAKV